MFNRGAFHEYEQTMSVAQLPMLILIKRADANVSKPGTLHRKSFPYVR